MSKFSLPAGGSLEDLKAYARRRENQQRRERYRKNPERALRTRLTSAANLLCKQGLIDEAVHASILSRLGGMKNG